MNDLENEVMEITEEESTLGVLQNLEKKELLAIIEKYTISVSAKNKNKPNNTELIGSILAYKKEQDVINGTVQLSQDELDAQAEREENKKQDENKAIPNKKLPRQARARLQRADLMRKELVMIHDNRTGQTKPNVEFVTWGNGLIGTTTTVVGFNQPKGQYVHRGALQNLRDAPAVMHSQDSWNDETQHIEVPAFTIIELAGLTEEEISAKAKQQQLRNAGVVI